MKQLCIDNIDRIVSMGEYEIENVDEDIELPGSRQVHKSGIFHQARVYFIIVWNLIEV